MNNKPIFKGRLPKDREAILDYFRIDSISDLAARLCLIPEEDKWQLMRDVILSIRTEVAHQREETPYLRAIEYLYSLFRFVESAKRFPTKLEQGGLFQELNRPSTR